MGHIYWRRRERLSWEEKYKELESLLTMRIAGHPDSWLSNYNVLKRGAQILFDESRKNKEYLGLTELGLSSVSALLLGLAIECLIKGCLSKDEEFINVKGTLNKKFKIHDLRRLVKYAKLDLCEDQLKVLDFLTQCVEWRGRYPIPRKGEDIDKLLYEFVDFVNTPKAIERAFVVCDFIEKCCTPGTQDGV